jgi:hypothetical protein
MHAPNRTTRSIKIRMSLESSVSLWDSLAFWLTVTGAALVFFGGVTSVVYRRYNRELLKVRASESQHERDATAKSIADAGARAAEANARAAEAQLALAKFKAPRTLTAEQSARVTKAVKPFAGMQFTIAVFNDPEPIGLMPQIENALASAGWIEVAWKGGGDIALTREGHPIAGFTIAQGLLVQADVSHPEIGSAVIALASALTAENVSAKPEIGRMPPNTNNDVVQILIGKKL